MAQQQAGSPPTTPTTAAPMIGETGRRPSFTQRLVGNGREWMSGFYTSMEKDDVIAGQGFGDALDDFVPTNMAYSQERRRNSSVSSDSDGIGELAGIRRGSITERVAGMQLYRKPKSNLESYAVGFATLVDDQN